MPSKKKEQENKYNMRQDFKCDKCATVVKVTGPCSKCKNETFLAFYTVQEI